MLLGQPRRQHFVGPRQSNFIANVFVNGFLNVGNILKMMLIVRHVREHVRSIFVVTMLENVQLYTVFFQQITDKEVLRDHTKQIQLTLFLHVYVSKDTCKIVVAIGR